MGKLYNKLLNDVRFKEGLHACMNCGICTAICPATSYYNYYPRLILTTIQTQDDEKIEELLKGEAIWYCGQCMSCKTRCPRDNAPGLIISVLRSLSQELGFFTESEKGRQQFAIKRTVGNWILKYGYCVFPKEATYEMHLEQGPVWNWYTKNIKNIVNKLGGNYQEIGPGTLRKIDDNTLDELQAIFDVTGGTKLFDTIEHFSKIKAKEFGMEFKESGIDNEYFIHTYTANNNKHCES